MEQSNDILTLPCMKQTAGGELLRSAASSAWGSVMTWEGWGVGREAQEGRVICILITGSCFCAAATNIVSQ